MKPISNYKCIYTLYENKMYIIYKTKSSKRTGLFTLLLECSEQVPSTFSVLSDTIIEGGTSSSTAVPDKSVDS